MVFIYAKKIANAVYKIASSIWWLGVAYHELRILFKGIWDVIKPYRKEH